MADDDSDESSYGGLLGAYPYAYRSSESRLFRSFVVLGGLLTLAMGLIFLTATVLVVANTLGPVGGTFTFVRAFFVVVAVAVLAPLLAPILLVARRHRRNGSTRRYDRGLAAAAYVYLASLYVMLVISAPPGQRDEPPAGIAPVVEILYGLPPAAGAIPPLLAVLGLYLVHRRLA